MYDKEFRIILKNQESKAVEQGSDMIQFRF